MMEKRVEVREVEYFREAKTLRGIRFAVFVDEQKVPANLEIDEEDPVCRHVIGYVDGEAVATGRLLSDGHIGRVAVLKPYRGFGVGRRVMIALIEMGKISGFEAVVLSAQVSARGFYEGLGFEAKGEVYLEAGIEHIEMSLHF